MSTLGKAALIVAALALTAGSASAADLVGEPAPVKVAPPQSGGWVVSVTPYLWAAGLSGDVGLFGRQPVNVDMSFGDIFDDLRFGGMVVGEVHNGTWGIFADVIYMNMRADATVSRTLGGVPLALSGSVETESFIGTLMGEYRMVDQAGVTLDAMAGMRLWSVNIDISLGLSAGGAPIAAVSRSDGGTWADAMVGIKGRYDLSPSWYLTGWGMVGGGASKISWDVLAGIGYQWNDRISVVAGYRALGVDYEHAGFVYDFVKQGPILGATFKF